jgi:hypothetical protein
MLTYEDVIKSLQSELKNSPTLKYVPDSSVIITNISDRDTLPTFKTYLIRLSAPDSGFLNKTPRIGKMFRYTYVVAIELWLKSGSTVADRLTKGVVGSGKGIYEFLKDVEGILEHNTLSGQLDPYAGSNISTPSNIPVDDKLTIGLSMLWYGNRDDSN